MAVIGSARPITRRVASSTSHRQHHAHDHVGPGQVVDVEDAVDDVFVVDEQIEDRRDAERRAAHSRAAVGSAFAVHADRAAVEQEDQRQARTADACRGKWIASGEPKAIAQT